MPKLIPDFRMWFDVPEEHAPGRIQILHLQKGEMAGILSVATDARIVHSDVGPVREIRQDLALEGDEILCRSVTDWEDFMDETGKELPCEPHNLRRFSREDWFIKFVKDCREKTAAAFPAWLEKHQKN